MLRIYQRLWQVNWAEQWQYRANLVMYLLYWLVSPVVYLAVWTTIANSQGSVGGRAEGRTGRTQELAAVQARTTADRPI